ncbi:MAG: DUF1501 domain-containing protein [Opitutaceae bacterium]|nr:DUF1501 domain-containing protein [Opitutaceae bacterium]
MALGSATRSLGGVVPMLPRHRRRILVVVRLDGGNDGFNTLIPFTDPLYQRLRPTLAVPVRQVLPIAPHLGLHPACAGLHTLFQSGQLRIIPNVGHPLLNRSHFQALEKWESAAAHDGHAGTGWLGRYLDWTAANRPTPARAIHFTPNLPLALRGLHSDELARPHPGGDDISASLRETARMIRSGHPADIYYLNVGGFDTHAHQALVHAHLLGTVSDALLSFRTELNQAHSAPPVLTVVWSEFGRSLAENPCLGTDHGKEGPVMLLGNRIGGLHGSATATEPLMTDFRDIYAGILEDWLECPSESVLGPEVGKVSPI